MLWILEGYIRWLQVDISVDEGLGLPIIVPVRQGARALRGTESKNQVFSFSGPEYLLLPQTPHTNTSWPSAPRVIVVSCTPGCDKLLHG